MAVTLSESAQIYDKSSKLLEGSQGSFFTVFEVPGSIGSVGSRIVMVDCVKEQMNMAA